MTTDADMALRETRDHLQDAMRWLAKIVVERIDGTADLRPEFVEALAAALTEMIATSQKIGHNL
jgi:hypothetical protein